MVIGVDMGASAVKLCGLEGNRVLFTSYRHGRGGDIFAMLKELDVEPQAVERIALTGLSASLSGLEGRGLELRYIPEPEAIGAGGCLLTGRDNVIVASIGTGTAFVHACGGQYTHICGTGVGAGTLTGLAWKVLGIDDMAAFDRMALAGDRGAVDLMVGDFIEGTDTLDPNMTASNLARMSDAATREDWAAGLTNLVLQVIGTMSLIACRGKNATAVVVTGAMADSRPSIENFASFTRIYGVEYVVPADCDCATAIGAARQAQL